MNDHDAPVRYESLLVIIPAFNEGRSIGGVVTSVRGRLGSLAESGLRVSICVIDDGSSDDTAVAARRAGADRVLVHKLNQGCGAAVRSGLLYGRDHGVGITVKLDADGQHAAGDIPDLIRPILEDRADVVYGNRFPRMTYRMPFVRRAGNMLFRTLMCRLTHWDIKDSQPGIFAVNDTYLKVCFIPGDYNYTQQVLLDSYLKGDAVRAGAGHVLPARNRPLFRFAQVPVQGAPPDPDADGLRQAAQGLSAAGGLLPHGRRRGAAGRDRDVARGLYDPAGREHQPRAGAGDVRPEQVLPPSTVATPSLSRSNQTA